MDAILKMLRERNKKVSQMLNNWEPSQRIRDYQEASKSTIISTYQTVLKKTLDEVGKAEARIKKKYEREPYTLTELNAGSVRYSALDTKTLEKEAQIIINSRLSVHPEKALLIGRELRARNKQNEADALSHHVTTFLDTPWIDDDEYRSLQGLKARITTADAQSRDPKGMLILDLSEHPKRESVISIDRFDEVRDAE